jgi:hypothetical protein
MQREPALSVVRWQKHTDIRNEDKGKRSSELEEKVAMQV